MSTRQLRLMRHMAWGNAWQLIGDAVGIRAQHPTDAQKGLLGALQILQNLELPPEAITQIANIVLLSQQVARDKARGADQGGGDAVGGAE